MTKPIERDPIYRGRRFKTETIELCVRWYITYRLSYRDLVAMMAELICETHSSKCHAAAFGLDLEKTRDCIETKNKGV